MAVMALIPNRPGRADCPSEIAVIEPPFNRTSCSAFTPQNLTNYGDGNPYRIHRPRRSRKLVPFWSEIWSTHQFGKECCSRHNHRRAAMAGNARCRQGEGHRPTAYLACANLISITRVYTRSARDHRPMLGDYASSCGSWSLYSAIGNIPMALSEAIIATYMTIHMARSPGSHTVGELRLLARSSGRERKSCGCGFQATKARVRFVRRAYPPCQRHRDAGVALARARTPPQHLAPYSEGAVSGRRGFQ